MNKHLKDNPFKKLTANGKKLFIPFTVLGDPDLKTSQAIIKTYIEAGADVLELGIPFSDPTADGPAIQEADQRALNSGTNVKNILKLLGNIRKISDIPISILTYLNPVYHFGVEDFYRKLGELKIEGLLIADVPFEEAHELHKYSQKYGVHQIFMVHEKTDKKRLKMLLKYASGYLYVVSSSSTTGVKREIPLALQKTLQFLRSNTELPLFVGFGISNRQQVKQIGEMGADGVIVGSHLVNIIKQNLGKRQEMLKGMLGSIEREIKKLKS